MQMTAALLPEYILLGCGFLYLALLAAGPFGASATPFVLLGLLGTLGAGIGACEVIARPRPTRGRSDRVGTRPR